jgi:ABC-type Fe3+/spermidine/putrescine transport system ATPase subunit
MSDHIAIMADGRVHQVGTPEDVYARPATTFVAKFVGSTNLLDCERRDSATAEAGGVLLTVVGAPDDARYNLSVRPEVLHLGPEASACENRLAGLVEAAIYQGSDVELRIRAGGHQLKARGPVGRYGPGETVDVGWNSADAVAIPLDGAGAEAVESR